MKKFLKKANRGLLLSAVVLVILVFYLIADHFSFQSQKDTINQTVNNYFSDILKVNTSVKEISTENCDSIRETINKYWSDADSNSEWVTKKSDMINFVSNISESKDPVYDITDADFSIKNVKIKKIGPGYASATISYSISITGKSDSFVITPSNYRILSDTKDEYYFDEEDEYYFDEEDEENTKPSVKESKDGTLKYSVSDAIIELHKDGNEWKIVSFDAYSDNVSFEYLSEE